MLGRFLRIRPILIVHAGCAPIMAACAPSMIPAVCYCTGLIPGVQGVRSRPLICRIDRLDQACCAPHWLQCFRPVVRPRFLQLKSTSCTGLIRPLVRAADSGRLCGSTSNRLADHRRLCASLVAPITAGCAPHWLRRSPPVVWSSTNPRLPGLAVQVDCAPHWLHCFRPLVRPR